jgi:hypothetical protein
MESKKEFSFGQLGFLILLSITITFLVGGTFAFKDGKKIGYPSRYTSLLNEVANNLVTCESKTACTVNGVRWYLTEDHGWTK